MIYDEIKHFHHKLIKDFIVLYLHNRLNFKGDRYNAYTIFQNGIIIWQGSYG